MPGKLGWVSFDHYTARPTIDIPHTEADGTKTTLIQTIRNPKVAGDMQLHTHVTTPNVVVCADGSVGSMDMLALHDRVHEIGAYYHAPSGEGGRQKGSSMSRSASPWEMAHHSQAFRCAAPAGSMPYQESGSAAACFPYYSVRKCSYRHTMDVNITR